MRGGHRRPGRHPFVHERAVVFTRPAADDDLDKAEREQGRVARVRGGGDDAILSIHRREYFEPGKDERLLGMGQVVQPIEQDQCAPVLHRGDDAVGQGRAGDAADPFGGVYDRLRDVGFVGQRQLEIAGMRHHRQDRLGEEVGIERGSAHANEAEGNRLACARSADDHQVVRRARQVAQTVAWRLKECGQFWVVNRRRDYVGDVRFDLFIRLGEGRVGQKVRGNGNIVEVENRSGQVGLLPQLEHVVAVALIGAGGEARAPVGDSGAECFARPAQFFAEVIEQGDEADGEGEACEERKKVELHGAYRVSLMAYRISLITISYPR